MKKTDRLHTHAVISASMFTLLMLTSSVLCTAAAEKKAPATTIEFTVSMENPEHHYFHVAMTYSGFKDKSVELKMPSWTPGYYMIMDYARNVVGFDARDASGNILGWKKTEKNRWKINTEKTNVIKVTYDVYSFRTSVADSYLDDGRGFISPTGIFMHPAGQKNHPVTVRIIPYSGFSKISTGLDPVQGKDNTFYAPDYDVLYDCPVLAGNQEILTFETGGIPYTIAAENLGNLDRSKLTDDYKKIVETATSIFGEVPFRHYTFIMMSNGMGGLEHTSSMAVFSNRLDVESTEPSDGWLSFIAHEFFHVYNVKTIRPIALGPFDYDNENYTDMLWFSEGVTSYYENLILNRAGFFSKDDVLKEMQKSIEAYENIPGHLFQSLAESSTDSWIYFLYRSENAANTTISYYDKGTATGMLLDLKIRHESGNKRSLDDVMRTLYMDFYKQKKRGFTDKEFRSVCEKTAGASLSEIFDIYIPTVQAVDYSKYLSYAGLSIDTALVSADGAWTGASVREDNGGLMVTSVEWDSPSYNAGLSFRDLITEINGEKATSGLLNNILQSGKPGEKITFTIKRHGDSRKIEVIAGSRKTRSFEIKPVSNPAKDQSALLEKWLK